VIRTRGIQLPKLALYQAELRPVAPEIAESLAPDNLGGPSEKGRISPNRAEASRILPEPGLTRERVGYLLTVLEASIARHRAERERAPLRAAPGGRGSRP
jgi:hypothetical protein